MVRKARRTSRNRAQRSIRLSAIRRPLQLLLVPPLAVDAATRANHAPCHWQDFTALDALEAQYAITLSFARRSMCSQGVSQKLIRPFVPKVC
jgi:hypothetical protein